MSNPLVPTQSPLSFNPSAGFSGFSDNATTPPLVVADDVTPLRWFLVEVVGTADNDDNLSRWSSFIGIVIAIAGNVLISLALNIQKYSHTRLQREAEQRRAGLLKIRRLGRQNGARDARVIDEENASEDEPLLSRTTSRPSRLSGRGNGARVNETSLLLGEKDVEGEVSFLKSPYWWLGLTMMVFGETGNFLAYGFAPASIVSPLGVVALISNCVVAPMMLKEPFRARDLLGVFVSIAGAVVVVWSAEKEETKLGPDEILLAISQTAFEIYFVVTATLIIILMKLSSKFGDQTILIDLGLVGLFGGYTVLSTKGISSLISSSFYHIFQYPIAYLFAFVLVSTAVLQVKYINRALQRFDSTQVIPTQFVLFTISVIVGSAVLYRDFETVGKARMMKFITGCTLTFVGVYLISSQRPSRSRAVSFDDDEFTDEDAYSEPISRDSRANVDIPTTPIGPAQRLWSTVNSNVASVVGTPVYTASPEAIARGLQSAAADPLFGSSTGTPLRKRASEAESMNIALGLAPGSNLMTGYQLQNVIADRVSGSLGRTGDELGGVLRRRNSLSLVMDFVTGKRNAGSGTANEDETDGSDSESGV
ncbi:magnesium transporter NIPA-domain-containing protein [Pyronema omphalodes]|nr:magnesium transporter NIPA-domain-containing protein [Pyronema omphalodes]